MKQSVLFVAGTVLSWRRIAAWVLLVWAALHLVGGAVLSVLPLPILPFFPDQSFKHYAFHGLYGLLQLPLIVGLIVWLRRTRSSGRSAGPADEALE